MTRLRAVNSEHPDLFRAVTTAGAIASLLVSALLWLGGKILSPGDRVSELAAQVVHADSLLAGRLLAQEQATSALQRDVLFVLTLKCTDQPVQKIRDRGQFAAAARCASLVNTGE